MALHFERLESTEGKRNYVTMLGSPKSAKSAPNSLQPINLYKISATLTIALREQGELRGIVDRLISSWA